MSNVAKIDSIIRPVMDDMGFDLVRLKLIGVDRLPILQIMADKKLAPGETVKTYKDRAADVQDCRLISKTLAAILDVEDPISRAYTLEVSSPGIDRPLVRLEDYEHFKTHEVKLEAPTLETGRKRYTGVITEVQGNDITLTDDQGVDYIIPFDAIEKSKLTLTNALIQAFQKEEV